MSKLPAKHSLSADPSLPAPTATAPNPDMIIDSYKLLFYAFMVNLSLQSMFPDPIKDVPKHVRDTLDESERDFWSSLTAIKRRESQWEGTERATWESFKKVSGHVRNSSQFMNRFLE